VPRRLEDPDWALSDLRTDPVRYRYDFGDDWEHALEFEELLRRTAVRIHVASAALCLPPEDVEGRQGTRSSWERSRIAGTRASVPA